MYGFSISSIKKFIIGYSEWIQRIASNLIKKLDTTKEIWMEYNKISKSENIFENKLNKQLVIQFLSMEYSKIIQIRQHIVSS